MKWLLEWLREGRKQEDDEVGGDSEEEAMTDEEFGSGRKRRARKR